MNFKQFRTEKGLTQAQAGALIGMSAAYWSQLETGQESPQKERAFARVLTYVDHPDIDLPLTAERMKSVKDFGLNFSQASEQIGASANVWSNLLNGHLEHKTRWTRSVNALLIEVAEGSKPALDLQPSGEIEIVSPRAYLTPDPEIDMQSHGLVPFSYGPQLVRMKWIDSEPWWVLRDVCAAIGYAYPENAPALIDEEDLQKLQTLTPGGTQSVLFVNESGLYQFLARVQVDSAKPFQRWLFKEVLPQIRKTGSYQAQPQITADPLSQVAMIGQALQTIAEQMKAQAATIEAQAQQIAEIEARPAFDSSQSARATIHELQRIKERKRDLHRLKSAIVKQAEANTDSYSKEFRKHGRVWRYIHAEANPPVSCINDYLTIAQINTAIEATQILLTRLGGAIPEQLSININGGAA